MVLRRFMVAYLAGVLLFGVSCGSKKKRGDGDGDSAISSKEMIFDPSGSDSGNIQGLTTVNFPYDQARLTSSSRRLLAENAEWIRNQGDVTVQIEGHCDDRGSVEYNLALGERRAKAVKNYLVSLGIDSNRLTVLSYGKEKPLELGDSEASYSRNRRANFVPISN